MPFFSKSSALHACCYIVFHSWILFQNNCIDSNSHLSSFLHLSDSLPLRPHSPALPILSSSLPSFSWMHEHFFSPLSVHLLPLPISLPLSLSLSILSSSLLSPLFSIHFRLVFIIQYRWAVHWKWFYLTFAGRTTFLRRRRRTGVFLYPSAITCKIKWVKVEKIRNDYTIYGMWIAEFDGVKMRTLPHTHFLQTKHFWHHYFKI